MNTHFPAKKYTVFISGDCQLEEMKASSSNVRVVGNFVPKCRVSDGLYANKQCHGSTGECWCVNPNTGKEIPNTRKGPGQGQVKCRSKYMSQRKK